MSKKLKKIKWSKVKLAIVIYIKSYILAFIMGSIGCVLPYFRPDAFSWEYYIDHIDVVIIFSFLMSFILVYYFYWERNKYKKNDI